MISFENGMVYLGKLRDHALRRLPDMLHEKRMLFSFRSTLGSGRWMNEGISVRYSAIAVLGLLEAGRRGHTVPVDLERIIEQLALQYKYATSIGDLGLILWVLARKQQHGNAGKKLEEVLSYTVDSLRYEREKGKRVVDSMELSWILLALLECRLLGIDSKGFDAALENAYLDLAVNFHNETSLFSFNRVEEKGMPHRFKRLSFFAEQIYGILALATFYQATGEREALNAAEACADRMASFQTASGGWPWRYNAVKGTMAEVFPLYAVHQDGMAPLALAKLTSLSSRNYLPFLFKGITWLGGDNEISTPIFDEKLDIVWRSVLRKGPFKLLSEMNKALSLISTDNIHLLDRFAPFYEIKREVRSYHLGWILCASAAVEDLDKKLLESSLSPQSS